jgi:hypothetical protein
MSMHVCKDRNKMRQKAADDFQSISILSRVMNLPKTFKFKN